MSAIRCVGAMRGQWSPSTSITVAPRRTGAAVRIQRFVDVVWQLCHGDLGVVVGQRVWLVDREVDGEGAVAAFGPHRADPVLACR